MAISTGCVIKSKIFANPVLGTIRQFLTVKYILQPAKTTLNKKNAGKHDNQYSTEKAENVYNVAWSDVTPVKWPAPPKACTKCGAKSAKKLY